jgi:predicted small lipoprotein YifL
MEEITMKKLIATILVLAMALSLLTACGAKNDTPAADAPAETPVEVPGSALEILETVWALYGDDEKFPVIGGDANNMVDGAPGAFNLEDGEMAAYQLLVPADQLANIDQAASLFHGMMLNNFTCGVFHVTGNANDFASAMVDAVKNNQWMCGMPETMLVGIIGGEYVVMAFGINDAMTPFEAKLMEAYPATETVANEPVV